jgi:ABC-type branched-subunit amino acid transport system substrate-binding protein
MKRYLFLAAVILMTFMLIFGGCSSSPAATAGAKTLKIGVLADLSGFLSVFYLEATHDMQLTADYINAHGGVKAQGQQYNIELVIRDSKSSPDGALAAANQAIFQDQVKYVIGPIAFEGAATTPLFEQNKIFHIFNSSTTSSQEMSASSPYAFAGDSNTVDFGTALAMIAKKEYPKAKTVVIVYPDDGTPQFVAPKIYANLQAMGYTPLNNNEAVKYPNDMQDFSPIASILKTINPDLIIQPAASPPHVYGILKGIRSLGMSSVYATSLFPGDPNSLIQAVGADSATNFVCLNYRKDNPNYAPVLKDLIPKLDPKSPFFTFTLGNCLMDLTNVMNLANSLDVDAVKAKWESLDTISSVYGSGKVGGDKTTGLHHHTVTFPLYYEKYTDGKIVTDVASMVVDPGATP